MVAATTLIALGCGIDLSAPALREIHEPLAEEHAALESDLFAAMDGSPDGVPSAESIRTRANSLVLRSAHALLTAA